MMGTHAVDPTHGVGAPTSGPSGPPARHTLLPVDPRGPAPTPYGDPGHSGWSDSAAREVLQLVVESVAEMVGFEVAVLSVVLDGQLVTMAYTGPDRFREYVYQTDPVHVLDPVLASAENWGRFRFLAAEDYDGELEGHWVVTVDEAADVADAWDPMDVLMGLLTDDAGDLIGVLAVDKPITGKRPAAPQRRLLERYAAQAERAVVTAFERETLGQQIAHAEAARRLVRAASRPGNHSLADMMRQTHQPLLEGFGATGSWIQVFDDDGPGVGHQRHLSGLELEPPEDVAALTPELATWLWQEKQALVLERDADTPHPALDPAGIARLRGYLDRIGMASALAVPLGAGSTCLGLLSLTRRPQDPPWSSIACASALEIGHDLGAALMTTRALERERALVHQLQQLDDYRSQLISTLSHELRSPLTVISGNLELLGATSLDPDTERFRQAMTRGSRRMQKVVDDLLLLARVSDPRHPLQRRPVDLRVVASDVVTLVDTTARAKGLAMHTELAEATLMVPGDATELDRLLTNLVSNAVKYTPRGGTVTVSLADLDDRVVLRVADDGLGISETDQAGLFRAFFRTTNPEALREQGTGLGLSIVATIAERHGGTVDVSSQLGEGTTFTVTLPAA